MEIFLSLFSNIYDSGVESRIMGMSYVPDKYLADFLEDSPMRKVLEVGWLWILLLIVMV